MKSKAEVIRENLAGQRVLDLGGSGWGADNGYERELKAAWALAKSRTVVDYSDRGDFQYDFNQLPLKPLVGEWDITTAFDVLEHLEHPADVLRWIPTDRLIISLPNGQSALTRRMERQHPCEHLYNFTPYTSSILLKHGGWSVEKYYYVMGKWSLLAKGINLVGSIYPPAVATGFFVHCHRIKK